MTTTETRTAPRRHRVRPSWPRRAAPLVVAALPWTWFLIRDATPSLNIVAFVLPGVAGVATLVALAVAALVARIRAAIVAGSLLVFTIAIVVGPRLPRSSPEPIQPFRLVAANAYDLNLEPLAAARALVAQDPDVLVAVETKPAVLTALRRGLPTHSLSRFAGLNVMARWPVRHLGPIRSVPPATAMRVEVLRPGGPFVLYALHLANPLHDVSFSQSAGTVSRVLRAAEAERLPVVVAGDFNMTDRTTSYRLLDAALRDAMRSSYAGSTYERGLWTLLQLRIDHVFTTPRWCGANPSTFAVPGSDHRGLSVELGPCG